MGKTAKTIKKKSVLCRGWSQRRVEDSSSEQIKDSSNGSEETQAAGDVENSLNAGSSTNTKVTKKVGNNSKEIDKGIMTNNQNDTKETTDIRVLPTRHRKSIYSRDRNNCPEPKNTQKLCADVSLVKKRKASSTNLSPVKATVKVEKVGKKRKRRNGRMKLYRKKSKKIKPVRFTVTPVFDPYEELDSESFDLPEDPEKPIIKGSVYVGVGRPLYPLAYQNMKMLYSNEDNIISGLLAHYATSVLVADPESKVHQVTKFIVPIIQPKLREMVLKREFEPKRTACEEFQESYRQTDHSNAVDESSANVTSPMCDISELKLKEFDQTNLEEDAKCSEHYEIDVCDELENVNTNDGLENVITNDGLENVITNDELENDTIDELETDITNDELETDATNVELDTDRNNEFETDNTNAELETNVTNGELETGITNGELENIITNNELQNDNYDERDEHDLMSAIDEICSLDKNPKDVEEASTENNVQSHSSGEISDNDPTIPLIISEIFTNKNTSEQKNNVDKSMKRRKRNTSHLSTDSQTPSKMSKLQELLLSDDEDDIPLSQRRSNKSKDTNGNGQICLNYKSPMIEVGDSDLQNLIPIEYSGNDGRVIRKRRSKPQNTTLDELNKNQMFTEFCENIKRELKNKSLLNSTRVVGEIQEEIAIPDAPVEPQKKKKKKKSKQTTSNINPKNDAVIIKKIAKSSKSRRKEKRVGTDYVIVSDSDTNYSDDTEKSLNGKDLCDQGNRCEKEPEVITIEENSKKTPNSSIDIESSLACIKLAASLNNSRGETTGNPRLEECVVEKATANQNVKKHVIELQSNSDSSKLNNNSQTTSQLNDHGGDKNVSAEKSDGLSTQKVSIGKNSIESKACNKHNFRNHKEDEMIIEKVSRRKNVIEPKPCNKHHKEEVNYRVLGEIDLCDDELENIITNDELETDITNDELEIVITDDESDLDISISELETDITNDESDLDITNAELDTDITNEEYNELNLLRAIDQISSPDKTLTEDNIEESIENNPQSKCSTELSGYTSAEKIVDNDTPCDNQLDKTLENQICAEPDQDNAGTNLIRDTTSSGDGNKERESIEGLTIDLENEEVMDLESTSEETKEETSTDNDKNNTFDSGDVSKEEESDEEDIIIDFENELDVCDLSQDETSEIKEEENNVEIDEDLELRKSLLEAIVPNVPKEIMQGPFISKNNGQRTSFYTRGISRKQSKFNNRKIDTTISRNVLKIDKDLRVLLNRIDLSVARSITQRPVYDSFQSFMESKCSRTFGMMLNYNERNKSKACKKITAYNRNKLKSTSRYFSRSIDTKHRTTPEERVSGYYDVEDVNEEDDEEEVFPNREIAFSEDDHLESPLATYGHLDLIEANPRYRWFIFCLPRTNDLTMIYKSIRVFYRKQLEDLYIDAETSISPTYLAIQDDEITKTCKNKIEFGVYAFPGMPNFTALGPYPNDAIHYLTILKNSCIKLPFKFQERNKFFSNLNDQNKSHLEINCLWWNPLEIVLAEELTPNELNLNTYFNGSWYVSTHDTCDTIDIKKLVKTHPCPEYSVSKQGSEINVVLIHRKESRLPLVIRKIGRRRKMNKDKTDSNETKYTSRTRSELLNAIEVSNETECITETGSALVNATGVSNVIECITETESELLNKIGVSDEIECIAEEEPELGNAIGVSNEIESITEMVSELRSTTRASKEQESIYKKGSELLNEIEELQNEMDELNTDVDSVFMVEHCYNDYSETVMEEEEDTVREKSLSPVSLGRYRNKREQERRNIFRRNKEFLEESLRKIRALEYTTHGRPISINQLINKAVRIVRSLRIVHLKFKDRLYEALKHNAYLRRRIVSFLVTSTGESATVSKTFKKILPTRIRAKYNPKIRIKKLCRNQRKIRMPNSSATSLNHSDGHEWENDVINDSDTSFIHSDVHQYTNDVIDDSATSFNHNVKHEGINTVKNDGATSFNQSDVQEHTKDVIDDNATSFSHNVEHQEVNGVKDDSAKSLNHSDVHQSTNDVIDDGVTSFNHIVEHQGINSVKDGSATSLNHSDVHQWTNDGIDPSAGSLKHSDVHRWTNDAIDPSTRTINHSDVHQWTNAASDLDVRSYIDESSIRSTRRTRRSSRKIVEKCPVPDRNEVKIIKRRRGRRKVVKDLESAEPSTVDYTRLEHSYCRERKSKNLRGKKRKMNIQNRNSDPNVNGVILSPDGYQFDPTVLANIPQQESTNSLVCVASKDGSNPDEGQRDKTQKSDSIDLPRSKTAEKHDFETTGIKFKTSPKLVKVPPEESSELYQKVFISGTKYKVENDIEMQKTGLQSSPIRAMKKSSTMLSNPSKPSKEITDDGVQSSVQMERQINEMWLPLRDDDSKSSSTTMENVVVANKLPKIKVKSIGILDASDNALSKR